MSIDKTNIHILKTAGKKHEHEKETMALLKNLLEKKGWNQRQLAKILKRDTTTVNRWAKNSREITWDNAEAIAKVLKCHPVEIYKPHKDIALKFKCGWDGYVRDLSIEEQHPIEIPYEYYHSNIRAVQMESPGTASDGEIWLFDIPKNKKFTKNCVGKICYLTASQKFIKKNRDKMKDTKQKCVPLIALLKPTGTGKLNIVNSYTSEPINPLCNNLDFEDLEIASPVKVKYDPQLLSHINK